MFLIKSCNSIITDPIFITTHLNRTKSLSSNKNNGYLHYTPERVTDDYYSSFKEWCTVVCNKDHTLTLISRSEIPFFYDIAFCFCNGIVCIASHDEDYVEILYLWNSLRCLLLLLWLVVLRVLLMDLHIILKTMISKFSDLFVMEKMSQRLRPRFTHWVRIRGEGCVIGTRYWIYWGNASITLFIF